MKLLAAAAVLLATLPLVAAGPSGEGATVGMNLGFSTYGLWDVWQFDHPGGATTIGLTWAPLPGSHPTLGPLADYDLHLYVGTALNDGVLSQAELIQKSQTRSFTPHAESIAQTLPAGRYYVAIMPFQAQGEIYEVTATAGFLGWATTAPGVCSGCY